MKIFLLYATILLAGSLCMTGCSSSKKAEKSPIKTFVMPCSELKSGDGVLRAWGSGSSDSEISARKKAQVTAAADLAAMLSRTVDATTEEYTAALSDAQQQARSKSLLTDKTKVTVSKTITNASIACDRWTKDEQTGQYTNYIVLEIDGDDYIKLLAEELNKDKNTSIDMELLEKIFMKHIEGNK